MTYCIEVWGSSPATHINSIVKIQKKAVRIISFSNFRAPSKPLFLSLNLLTFPQIYQLSILSFMHKFHHNRLPIIFSRFYTLVRDTHSFNTRGSTNFQYHVPRCRLQLTQNSIKVKGPFFWNSLPNNISISSLPVFKSKVKCFLKSL